MHKQEISEIKKLFTMKNCSITRICGCYVDGEKNKKTQFGQAFLALPEEEMFKYFEILRKCLSGTLGKNLLNLEFPLAAEETGGPQNLLLRLRDSKLKDEVLLDAFYDKIIETYEYVGNYLILLVHDVYDVPGKTTDGFEMEDASDEIYEYVLACICPVNLTKPGLSYNALENLFQNRTRDWVVDMPEAGFLFPAFNDRTGDIHGLLYYVKDADELKDGFADQMFGSPLPMPATSQKDTFHAIIEDTLGSDCDVETVKTIHENLIQMVEEHKDEPEPLVLNKQDMKALLCESGVSNERLSSFDTHFEETAGERATLVAGNVFNARSFEVKTPDVVVKVKPERTDLIETRVINGRNCLVIALDGNVEVNGVTVKAGHHDKEEEE